MRNGRVEIIKKSGVQSSPVRVKRMTSLQMCAVAHAVLVAILSTPESCSKGLEPSHAPSAEKERATAWRLR
eukprot:7384234-Prymnesium_polylepis.1